MVKPKNVVIGNEVAVGSGASCDGGCGWHQGLITVVVVFESGGGGGGDSDYVGDQRMCGGWWCDSGIWLRYYHTS